MELMQKSNGLPAAKRFTLTWLGEKDWPALLLWFGLSILVAAKELLANNANNFSVFRYVYLHLVAQQPLYIPYPENYYDVNMYGPVYSIIIAPFAVLPFSVGAMLWVIANALFLYIAIRKLPITRVQQNLVLIFSSHELMGSSSYFQFNPSIIACLILSFVLIRQGKDFWAAFFIMIAAMVKLYGIVGLAFFFFSKHRWRLIVSLILWGAVLWILPAVISSFDYIVQSYREWGDAIVQKNKKNYKFDEGVIFQNISAMGFIQRVFHLKQLNNLWVLCPAFLLFGTHYLRLKWKENREYCLYLLCSVLLFTVIFSTSSESPTYIISFPAVCIWYVMQKPTRWNNALFIFVLIFTSFAHSDLLTPWMRHNVMLPYAGKAFPSIVMWLVIVYQIWDKQFLRLPPQAGSAAAA